MEEISYLRLDCIEKISSQKKVIMQIRGMTCKSRAVADRLSFDSQNVSCMRTYGRWWIIHKREYDVD